MRLCVGKENHRLFLKIKKKSSYCSNCSNSRLFW